MNKDKIAKDDQKKEQQEWAELLLLLSFVTRRSDGGISGESTKRACQGVRLLFLVILLLDRVHG